MSSGWWHRHHTWSHNTCGSTQFSLGSLCTTNTVTNIITNTTMTTTTTTTTTTYSTNTNTSTTTSGGDHGNYQTPVEAVAVRVRLIRSTVTA